jgi:hypothetical protein
MAKAITTALRLMRLLMACWERPVLTLKDIQDLCQDDHSISEETAYNYIASLQSLGVELKRLSPRTWYIQKTPRFPPFQHQHHIHSLYARLGHGHPLLDRLLGNPVSADTAFLPSDGQGYRNLHPVNEQLILSNWARAVANRQLCHIHTHRSWITGVPIPIHDNGLRVWDVDHELPIRFNTCDVLACIPQPQIHPELLLPRVIVQYEITGNLVRRFEPTQHDTILERHPDRLRVANRCDDALMLCKRLLRYQLHCRVIAPDRFRQFMLAELNWLRYGAGSFPSAS